MALPSMAAAGVAKTLVAVTISLHPAPAHHGGAAPAHHGGGYATVRPGDSLSAISKREYGSAAVWPALWWINRHRVPNPSVIQPGQRLHLSAWHPVRAWLTRAAVAAIPASPAWASPAAGTVAPTGAAPAPVASAGAYSAAPGSFQSCVIRAESGGNPRAVNPSSGAGGLYGFLPSTWQALGYSGLPQNASVSQQSAAFAKQYARSGTSAWAPYDGC
jgi:resuscitation-promoting factor RpfC